MKKLTSVVLLFTLFTCSVFALTTNFHLGLLSGAGVSKEYGNWEAGVNIESTFPCYAIGNTIVGKLNDAEDLKAYFKIGSLTFIGADVYGYRQFSKNISAGADFKFGYGKNSKTFEAALIPSLKLNCSFKNNISVFAVVGIPVVNAVYTKGFKAPLVRIPELDIFSFLTSCRFGLTVNL